jgi:hypothetical protein
MPFLGDPLATTAGGSCLWHSRWGPCGDVANSSIDWLQQPLSHTRTAKIIGPSSDGIRLDFLLRVNPFSSFAIIHSECSRGRSHRAASQYF